MIRDQVTVEEMCRKLRPILGAKADQIFFAWRMTLDKERKFQIEQALNALYVKHLDTSMLNHSVLLEPPKEEQVAGDYPFGLVSYAGKELFPFGLREQDFQRHICVTGMSGSGKTNLGFQILKGLMNANKPFIVFDWKQSFRPLLSLDPDILLFTVGDERVSNHFKININIPPKGIDPKEWISILADIINESFFASHGVHKLISEALDEAFMMNGIYKGGKNYPTWHDVKMILEDKQEEYKRGRENEWLASALRIAHALTFGGFGGTINARDSTISVEELLERQVIFEMQSLGATEKKFFCEYLLTYIYKLKKANRTESNPGFKSAILVDEAHNIFLKEKPVFMKESIVDSIYREIREYGISLICMDQHISKLSEVVPGNSACNIVFQQMLPQDIQTSSGVMMLENKEYFSMLPVGCAIVRLAERYHRPFLIKVPLISPTKERILDEELIARMTDLMQSFLLEKIVRESRDEEDEQRLTIAPLLNSGSAAETELSQEHIDGSDEYRSRLLEKKAKMERDIERQQKVLDRMEREKEKELEKIESHLNGAKVLVSSEPGMKPKNIEHEAVGEIRGPREFLEKETRKTLTQLEDQDFAHTLRLQNEGKWDKQFKLPTPSFEDSHSLTSTQLHFMRTTHTNPQLSVSQLYKHLLLSGRKGNQLKDELVALGYIEVVEDRTDKGWKKFLKLTPASQAVLAD